MTSAVKQLALERAITTLRALNCQFKIITPGNEEYGELQIVVNRETKKRRRRRGLIEGLLPVADLQVGDVRTFTVSSDFPTSHDLKTTLQKHLWRHFGAGSTIVEPFEDRVEVLRVK